MKKLILVFFVLAGCSQKQSEEAAVSSLSAPEFNKLLSGNAALLDVRTQAEFDAGFIKGAVNLDFKASDFGQKLDSLDKSKDYLVYCASGGRSSRAADLMKEKGFTSVKTLEGGTQAWEAAGFLLVSGH